MVRTQIQLDEKQAATLKKKAASEGVSMAELIRRGVELYLRTSGTAGEDEVRKRALSAAGRFRSGRGDLSVRHDRYLAEAYKS
ncbi:MAG TPA: CopG family transcriptional regulator [Phycisphaerae bacterium]|nr:CopG family transcriptional regulator [Phycisphaerae bacterium]HRY67631.1 CopG family transcriptional regulator [Phycisphaerae bacterium]HSA25018.1 CopG family transcriptional regulator [Phycisphaerae bacterium]